MRAVIVLCEGPHDISFLIRILRTQKIYRYSDKIKDLPYPFNEYILRIFKEYDYENISLQEIKPPLPYILRKEDTFYFLYAMGGNTNEKMTSSIINKIISFIPREDDILFQDSSENSIENYTFVFFYDADDRGKSSVVNYIKYKYRIIFGEDIDTLEHSNIVDGKNYRIGCYVFSSENKDFGNLESVVIPLMKSKYEDMFEYADVFYERHVDMVEDRFLNKNKSLIGIVGQIENPGCSNSVIIQYSSLISDDKIKRSSQCKEILDFFKKV